MMVGGGEHAPLQVAELSISALYAVTASSVFANASSKDRQGPLFSCVSAAAVKVRAGANRIVPIFRPTCRRIYCPDLP